jgi:hypothetical protein
MNTRSTRLPPEMIWRKGRIVWMNGLLLALGLTVAVFLTTKPTGHDGGFDSDGVVYARMATAPLFAESGDIPPPWSYRVLTPKLASLVPGRLLDRFRAIAFMANLAALLGLYAVFAECGFPPTVRCLGVLLYAGVFWTLNFSFYSPAYIDHVTNLFLIAIVYCTLSKRYTAAVLILAVAALQKESLPLFGAFVGADVFHQGWRRDMRRASLFAAAATVVPLVAVTLVRAQFTAPAAGAAQVVLQEAWRSLHPPFWPVFVHAMFSGLGVLPVLLLARCRPGLALLRRRPAFVVYLAIAGTCLFGGIDKSRLFLYALPVLTCLSLASVASLEEDLDSWFPVWAMLFLCSHWYLGNYLTPLGTFSDYLAKLVPEHAAEMGAQSPLPYLLRDCLVAGVLFVGTILLSSRSLLPRRNSVKVQTAACVDP